MKGLSQFIFTAFLLLVSNLCFSQRETKFIGRLIHVNGNRELIKSVSIRLVNQGQSTTNNDGIFTIAINNKLSEVALELVDSELSVIYPIGGKASVPKDSDTVIEFYIGESTKDILTRAVARSNNEIKDRLTQLGVKQDGIEETLNAFRNEIQLMTNIKISDLKYEIDLASKRQEFYPTLASSITNYVNEAKDLKDAFKFVAKHAFEDPQALKVLSDAVNSYNIVFEDLNREHKSYEKKVNDLWQSEAKASEVRELFNYALGELHSANIFTLNLKLREINEYFRGNIKGQKKNIAKDSIIREIESSELQLDRRLDELDKRTQIVLSRLAI